MNEDEQSLSTRFNLSDFTEKYGRKRRQAGGTGVKVAGEL